jgi:type II secretory ATPase GspE/PulE/Tfp pilus assembly ATPase PilB-like protein
MEPFACACVQEIGQTPKETDHETKRSDPVGLDGRNGGLAWRCPGPHQTGCVADCAGLIISQRLIRKLCPHCAKPVKLSAQEEATFTEVAVKGGLAISDLHRDFRQPMGCAQCGLTGFRGMTIIAESLKMSHAVARALRNDAPAAELARLAIADGMTTMAADGMRKVAAGVTTLQEVQRVLSLAMLP